MTLGDAAVILLTLYFFSYWVKRNVKTKRGAYYLGAGLMFIFYLGVIEYCTR